MEDAHTPAQQRPHWFGKGASTALLLLGPVFFWVFVLLSLVLLLPMWLLFGVHAWQALPLLVCDLMLTWLLQRQLVTRVIRGSRRQLLTLTVAWLWAVVPCLVVWALGALNGD
jgi:hypothetical protein